MSSSSIAVANLAKRYRIGTRPNAYATVRDAIARSGRNGRVDDRELWALDGVSFDVAPGEAVGILGANGAGKTTLLKVLSRVTEPTRGEAKVRGRVGALLEVGTGFHPELTGRENIYLNGAILGMKRSEIAAKFDEIVAFAEVERFVDTPVKRYSSGMYVRLAFAVAAHLDADILLVDEVLSVGDLAFQRKCLGRMQEQTSSEGRTVLFVSHNLASIRMLTERCIWLDRGRVRAIGPTPEIFRNYVAEHSAGTAGGRIDLSDLTVGRPAGKDLEHRLSFEVVELLNASGEATDVHLESEPFTVRTTIRASTSIDETEFEIVGRLRTGEGVGVFPLLSGKRTLAFEPGLYHCSVTVDPNPLRPGTYQLELYCLTRVAQDLVPTAVTFRVEGNPQPGDDPRYAGSVDLGLFRVDVAWGDVTPAGA